MIQITVRSYGLKALINDLRSLPRVVEEAAEKHSYRIIKAIHRHMVRQAPRSRYIDTESERTPGTLKQSLKIETDNSGGVYRAYIVEGEESLVEWQGHGKISVGFLLDRGTQTHTITPRKAASLRFPNRAGTAVRRNRAGDVLPGPTPRGTRGFLFADPSSSHRGIRKAPSRIAVQLRSRIIRRESEAERVYAKAVVHPGTEPDAFIDRAIQAAQPAIDRELEAFAKKIDRHLGGSSRAHLRLDRR